MTINDAPPPTTDNRQRETYPKHEDHVKANGGYGAQGFNIPVSLHLLPSIRGSISFEICDTCHEIIHVHCDHSNNSWNAQNTILRCNLCGMDVT